MMKKLYLIITIILFVASAQSQNLDYKIYSIVLNNTTLNWTKDETIILINKLEQNQDFSLIKEFTNEKKDMPDWAINELYNMTRKDSIFREKLLYDYDLKKAISGLISQFNNHPKLEIKNMQTNKKLVSISVKKYYRYFGKKHYKKTGWKNVREDYDSNWIVELSKINYSGKFACLYYAHYCGSLCGLGELLILEKDGEEWKIIGELDLWMS